MFRVIGMQETGEEIIVADRLATEWEAQKVADMARERYIEWRGVWIERHPYADLLYRDCDCEPYWEDED